MDKTFQDWLKESDLNDTQITIKDADFIEIKNTKIGNYVEFRIDGNALILGRQYIRENLAQDTSHLVEDDKEFQDAHQPV